MEIFIFVWIKTTKKIKSLDSHHIIIIIMYFMIICMILIICRFVPYASIYLNYANQHIIAAMKEWGQIDRIDHRQINKENSMIEKKYI